MLLGSQPGFDKGRCRAPWSSHCPPALERPHKLAPDRTWNGALIVGQWKLLLGRQSFGFWQAPRFPNATTNRSAERVVECGGVEAGGCLFNIIADPSEYDDLAAARPRKLAEMRAAFVAANRSRFGGAAEEPLVKAQCAAYVARHRGFLGPYHEPGAPRPKVTP
jgi:hypothetical protein